MATAYLFEPYADRYDAWYEGPVGRGAYRSEVRALAPLMARCPRPWLEVGVGSDWNEAKA
ncbi:MAG: hypothetical protein C4298_05780 [Thermus sp.]